VKFRIAVAIALVSLAAAATAALAGSASAAVQPTVGQSYCIDGSFTFTTFDEYSAWVLATVVNDWSGVFTLWQESDPGSDDAGESVLQTLVDSFDGEDHGEFGDVTGETGGTLHHATFGACSLGAAPAPPVNIFLCYSVYQDQPGVWPKPQALALLQQGYWLAYAVPGNVPGGTNIGAFHLVCNLAAGQAAGDSFVGGDGTVLGPAYAGDAGLYPKVGP
jgi:hypothetical protein